MITPTSTGANGVITTSSEDAERRIKSWKLQTYVVGIGLGFIFSLLSSYLYVRAAEEDVARRGEPSPIKTTELIGLGLAALTLIRQITEMGKPNKGRK